MLTHMEHAAADDIEALLRAEQIEALRKYAAKPARGEEAQRADREAKSQAVIEQMTNAILQNQWSIGEGTTREDLLRDGFTTSEIDEYFAAAVRRARVQICAIERRGRRRVRVPAGSRQTPHPEPVEGSSPSRPLYG